MQRKAAAFSAPPYRLIPRATVAKDWNSAGERLELLIPRYRGPLFDRLLHSVMPPKERWIRYPLDPRGSRIFELIDGYRTAADIADIYCELYPGDCAQIRARVHRFLLTLERHGFVHLKRI